VIIRQRLDADALRLAATRVKASGDPTRLALAVALSDGDELCGCDLAWIAGRAENLVGHHLRTLRTAGLASSRRDGKIVLYTLTTLGSELVDAHLPAEQLTQ